jgi:type VI secretion system protein ImpJ
LAPLRHLWISKRGHPEELYRGSARAWPALCARSSWTRTRSTLPLYDHDRLSECFEALDSHIRAHLETMVPTNCVSIPLEKMSDCFYEGDVTDTRCLGRARWFLGIRARTSAKPKSSPGPLNWRRSARQSSSASW